MVFNQAQIGLTNGPPDRTRRHFERTTPSTVHIISITVVLYRQNTVENEKYLCFQASEVIVCSVPYLLLLYLVL